MRISPDVREGRIGDSGSKSRRFESSQARTLISPDEAFAGLISAAPGESLTVPRGGRIFPVWSTGEIHWIKS